MSTLALTIALALTAAPSFTDLVERSELRLRAGDPDLALKDAELAVAADERRFEGFYLVGLALYRKTMLDGAEAAWREALKRAPVERQGLIGELLTAVGIKRQFFEHLWAANAAAQRKEPAKAAAEYEAALGLVPVREDVQLAAALANRDAGNRVAAIRLLEALLSSTRRPEVSAECRKHLQALSGQADAAARDQLKQAMAAAGVGELTLARARVRADQAVRQDVQKRKDDAAAAARAAAAAAAQQRAQCLGQCQARVDRCRNDAASCDGRCRSSVSSECDSAYSQCLDSASSYVGNMYYYTASDRCRASRDTCASSVDLRCSSRCAGTGALCHERCDLTCP